MKRKVGYGEERGDIGIDAEGAMKKLCLAEDSEAQGGDVHMIS